MRAKWENALAKLEEEMPQARQEVQGAGDRIAAGQELKEKSQHDTGGRHTGGVRAR